jgi:hypothetical protein
VGRERACISTSCSPKENTKISVWPVVSQEDLRELLIFLAISVANIVSIASAMLPRPVEREIMSLVETAICQY